jgi:uroporphyrinogen decarboxylase
MVEGGGSKTWAQARRWIYQHPAESKKIMTALTDLIIKYLICQFDAGASVLQVFDTNGGELPPSLYDELCVPDLLRIAREVKASRPDVLLVVFPKDVWNLQLFAESEYDVVGVSWKDDPKRVRQLLPGKILQGNLDPAVLLTGNEEDISREVKRMFAAFGKEGYIANLGHGMMPEMNPEMANMFLEAVKSQ